jgi:RNA polymerase sigma-70 factor (ECF subfamily)
MNSKHELTEYLVALQKGEERGMKYFFDLYYRALLYYSFRITDDRAASKDAVQGAYIKLSERCRKINDAGKIKSWLYTTVRNNSINWWREQKKKRDMQEYLASSQENGYEKPVVDNMIAAEVTRDIHDHIATLPSECQKIFILKYREGKSNGEIAEELGLSIQTVKNQLRNGLIKLRGNPPDLY